MRNKQKSTIPQYGMADKRLLDVIEVKEITDINVVNTLLRDNWIVIQVIEQSEGCNFSMGKLKG